MTKTQLATLAEGINADTRVQLYLVTRHIKPGIPRSAKVLDKYRFQANKIDLAADLGAFFREAIVRKLQVTAENDDLQMQPYSVIGDDLGDSVYTYALNNALSFSDVISNQLLTPTQLPTVGCLGDVQNELWAFCWRVDIDGQPFFAFRKASKGKVTTDRAQSVKGKFAAVFDANDAELKEFTGSLLAFDDQIDCAYWEETFVVFRKGGFEQILGLEEELKENGASVVQAIEATGLVEGLADLADDLMESKTLLRTLASIAQKRTHEGLNQDEVGKMCEVLSQMEGRDLKTTDEGKVKLEDMHDLRDFVKLLNDFYKRGLVTGTYYGTNSGRKLDV